LIDFDPLEVVTTRRASDGRFVIFSSAGVTVSWPLPFWGGADTAGDGHGLLVRLDAVVAYDGWTVPTAEATLASLSFWDVNYLQNVIYYLG
jgi:hypothetical protein